MELGKHFARMTAGLVASAYVLSAGAAPADYAAWKAAHPQADAQVADLKAKTVSMIAAKGPLKPEIAQPPAIWRVPGAIDEIWDGPDAPEMVVLPAGEYTMGSPASEAGRKVSEGPQHRVRIGYPLAVSKYPITVGEYAKFVAAANFPIYTQCQTFATDKYESVMGCNWKTPGFPQTDRNPAISLSWAEAKAYAEWLSKKTGHAYRLLSESEYEYAARGGTTSAYWWGDDPVEACKYANGADLDAKARPDFKEWTVNNCHDGYAFTSPVGNYRPNGFGLYDVYGNSWSWVQDCWRDTYDGAPTDGSAIIDKHCFKPVKRGGAWGDTAQYMRSAARWWSEPGVSHTDNGFRVARVL